MRFAALLMAVIFAAPLSAQERSGEITGTVVDAERGDSLPGATLTLVPAGGDSLVRRRQTRTDRSGRYRFADVPHGAYRLAVARSGYRSRRVDVQLRSDVRRLSVALAPAAGDRGEDVRVRGRVRDTDGAPVSAAVIDVLGTGWRTQTGVEGRFELVLPPGGWRLRVSSIGYETSIVDVQVGPEEGSTIVDLRLLPDPVQLQALTVVAADAPRMAQTVTRQTIRRTPALVEADVFRGVVLLPGVAQPNDLKGRIHLAGGASDETGITLDGHTLQDPFHLLGLTGAFNVAALEQANVVLHRTDASTGGRIGGWIDLRTRRPEAEAARELTVSLLSSSGTMWQPELIGGIDLLVSARVTYIDQVMRLAQSAGYLEADVPRFGFHDAVLRLGRSWADWRVELTGFRTRDHFVDPEQAERGDVDHLAWGEQLVGLRLTGEIDGWDVSGRASFDEAWTRYDLRPFEARHVDSRRGWLATGVGIGRQARSWRLDLGASADHRRNRQTWEARGLIDELFAPNTPASLSADERQTITAVHGDVDVVLAHGWSAGTGLRVWYTGTSFHPSPRLHVGFRPRERVSLDAAIERRFQFDAQSEEPIEGSISPPLFLLRVPRRADMAAVTARWRPLSIPWNGDGELRLEAFARRYPDRPVLRDREPGQTREQIAASFPEFRRIEARTIGASVAARFTWSDDWAFQTSYEYQHAREEHSPGDWSPAAWEAPHALSLYLTAPGAWGWDVSAALQMNRGAAVTPIVGYSLAPSGTEQVVSHLAPRYLEGARNSLRLPAYQRLDLGARKSWSSRRAEWTFFLQVLNVLYHDNAIGYDWQQYFANSRHLDDPRPGRSGLPILPSLGLEVAW